MLDASGVAYKIKRRRDAQDPADELIRTAERADAEFIVIGLRRRSPVGKLLLGSNAQRVLLDAACPVLAVKAAPDALRTPEALVTPQRIRAIWRFVPEYGAEHLLTSDGRCLP